MPFNLNRTHNNDYALKTNHIKEMISMYGVECDFLFTEKMNKDKILMDFSHMKSDKNTTKITILPEESEQWGGGSQWDMFGLNNLRTMPFFISAEQIEDLIEKYKDSYPNQPLNNYKALINSLMVLPNGSFIEVTDIEAEVEGINNLYAYDDEKSVYRLVTRAYNNSRNDEIEHSSNDTEKTTIDTDTIPGIQMVEFSEDKIIDESMENLDEFFKSLDDGKEIQDTEGEKISNSDSVFGSLG